MPPSVMKRIRRGENRHEQRKNAFKNGVCLILAIITSIAMTMDYSIITSEELTKLSGFEGKLVHAVLTFQTLIPPASIMNFFIAALAFLLYRRVFGTKKHHFSVSAFFIHSAGSLSSYRDQLFTNG